MNPNMPMPGGPGAPMPTAPSGPAEIAVPLASLSQPDEQEVMQTPGEGDTITLQVDATITRLDGEMAYIQPTAINGKPISENEALEDPNAPDEAEGAGLRAEALTL